MLATSDLRLVTLHDLNRELFSKSAASLTTIVHPAFWRLGFLHTSWMWRDNPVLDDLFEYWLLLEVARVARVVPSHLAAEQVAGSSALQSVFVRQESRRRQLVLAWSLGAHLAGAPALPPIDGVNLRQFQWYLDLTMPLRRDPDVRLFSSALRRPGGDARLADALESGLRRDDRRATPVQLSMLKGFVHFCQYCGELESLLTQYDTVPHFRAVVWHSHPDWPVHHERIGWIVRRALDRLADDFSEYREMASSQVHWNRLAEAVERLLRSMPWPSEWDAFDWPLRRASYAR